MDENLDYSHVMLNRILHKGAKGKRMLVINDEAHHCYLPKKSDMKGKKMKRHRKERLRTKDGIS